MGVGKLFEDIVRLCPDLTLLLGWDRGTTASHAIPPCHPTVLFQQACLCVVDEGDP